VLVHLLGAFKGAACDDFVIIIIVSNTEMGV
jgi:hypothetical protein